MDLPHAGVYWNFFLSYTQEPFQAADALARNMQSILQMSSIIDDFVPNTIPVDAILSFRPVGEAKLGGATGMSARAPMRPYD